MPTYDYECKCCDHKAEIIQSITEEPLYECPRCRMATFKRVILGAPKFILSGGGWAKDGYSSSGDNGDS